MSMEKASFLDKLEKVKEKKRRVTVYLPPSLIKKLKLHAAEKETTISEIVEKTLETNI
ncbi:MAG: ribbon-helix-helix protein, CopG family [Candidatus Micrarchaeaceae archaeon]